ncbi:amidohydrolase family protein [Rhizobium leguminosarum]|uniref:amidohydrolase family protein n=1 Tax=Rhizobium leguminosarum TaxID=384 RepID=UPI003F9A35A2
MAIDLVIRNAFLPGSDGFTDIAFANGRIAAMAPHFVCDAPEYDARGRLISGGLIETHIHLDKAGIIGRCVLCTGTLAEAVSETSKAKAAFTEEDVYARAAGIVEQAILNGTNRLRTFVEIDGRAGFRSFDAIKRLRADYAAAIDIEICAFAQEGLTNDPGTEEMLDTALASGADLVGGCPYTDPNPGDHIRRIFDLGERYGVPVDFHLDFDLDPAGSNLPLVIAETLARGYQGRVSVGHVTKLSALPPEAFEAVGRSLAQAGVAVTVLPATDLFLTGRAANHLVPRGVTPAHRLAELGVLTTISTNNVLNPFTPFGDVSLIRMANLYANVAQIGTADALEAVFDMITTNAARLLGLQHYALDVGGPATLVLFDAVSGAGAVARLSPVVTGWKDGRQTFLRQVPRLLFGQQHQGLNNRQE